MKYRLEKLIEGEWWEEGTYTEGYFIKHLANASFKLGRLSDVVEDVRVIIVEEDSNGKD